MSTTHVQPPAPVAKRRGRRRRSIILCIAVAAIVGLGIYAYLAITSEHDVRDAIAEADRLDPGWRFDDLLAARPAVPDAENSALLVSAAHAKIPAKWTAPAADDTPHITERLAELSPEQRLTDAQLREARAELAKVAAALPIAREIADRPRGRWNVAWQRLMLVATLIPHQDQVRPVATVLVLDAVTRAADGDADSAVQSCQAVLNVGRSIGDEPTGISQLSRRLCAHQAVHALERVMAQAEASDRSLAAMQELLAAEAEVPALLIFARAERAMFFDTLETMRTIGLNRAAMAMKTSRFGASFDAQVDRVLARGAEPAYLRHGTAVVEIAKLPDQDQEDRLRALKAPTAKLPPLLDAMTANQTVDWANWARHFHRARATMRCAAVAVAAERYRLAKRGWPQDMDALVPRYLAAVPPDPFDGRPLRWRRLPDGIVIYSIGPDRTDDGGKLNRNDPNAANTDVGFRLWDADRRGAEQGRD